MVRYFPISEMLKCEGKKCILESMKYAKRPFQPEKLV